MSTKKLMIERANRRILNESLPMTRFTDFELMSILSAACPNGIPQEAYNKMSEIVKKNYPERFDPNNKGAPEGAMY